MDNTNFASYQAKIKVVGCGGGGCNAINRMVEKGVKGVEFISINTDAQHLAMNGAKTRIQIGPKLTRGLGAGGDHEVGRKAAEESREDIAAAIGDCDLLFVTAGMGGGTGTGSAGVVAEIGKQQAKALVIAIVTKPFGFEGKVRDDRAEAGIAALQKNADTLIIVPNDRLLAVCDYKVSLNDAFMTADEILRNGVQSIAELITVPGLVNLDFADVKAIMTGAGQAWMAMGKGTGPNRAVDAAKAAITSPMLEVSIEGAKGVLIAIQGDTSLGITEVNEAANIIRSSVDPMANIIFGVSYNAGLVDAVRITIIATGFTASRRNAKVNDDEIRQKLTELKEEDKLDTPTFLRHPLPQHKQQFTAPEVKAGTRPAPVAAPQYAERKFR
ncbi:MAG: cell division protein FtsZ [Dehalococcoidia bacterium]